MTTEAIAASSEPDGAPRIATLDIMRGVAILGILFMNINDMGGSLYASFANPRHLGWAPADQVAWWLRQVLANGTARCLLEMLFGAGMVILTDRFARAAREWRVLGRYYARNLILLLFGLVHIFILMWPGDILHTYALAALIVVIFRRLRPRWLIALGLSLSIFQIVTVSMQVVPEYQRRADVAEAMAKRDAHQPLTKADQAVLKADADKQAKRAKAKAADDAQIAAEDKGRTGDAMSWFRTQWGTEIDIQSQFLEPLFVWEAGATMLIGAALFKLGILQGNRSRRWYLWLMAIGYVLGIALRARAGWEMVGPARPFPWAAPFDEPARLLMTLGHVGLINWLAQGRLGARLLSPFTAAGRTALSIYILQTIATLWILFPPFAFALYGKLSWAPLMLTALAIDVVLLILANLYVLGFSIGPVEWAWRSLVERRALPWRARAAE